MDKSANSEGDSTSLPALASETMTVGSEYPRESLEEEGSGVESRRALISMRGKDEEKTSQSVPVTSVSGPMRSQETEEKDDNNEES